MRSVGMEEELLLVDAATGLPTSVAAQVLRIAEQTAPGADPVRGSLQHELQQQQLELDTAPQTDMLALETDLREWRHRAAAAAVEAGARVVAVATSPLPVVPRLVRTTRYEAMSIKYGLTTNEQLTCGCHVHVSVDSDEEAVGVLDRIRVWLPVLLALSANSPFWQGADSGYASFRSQAWARWPSAGPPDLFGGAHAYRQRVADLIASGVVLDEGMVYFDARPSRRYPTLEVRVADVCLEVRDAVLIGTLCRGLVETAAREWAAGTEPPPVATAMLRLAAWQAGREGITGALLDPGCSRPWPAADVVRALVDHVRAALRDCGDEAMVEERVGELFARGTGAQRQRTVWGRTGRLADVVADLVQATTPLKQSGQPSVAR